MENKENKEKTVEIPMKEFQELMNNLENCKKDKEKLINTIEFLNNEIKKVNQNYAIPSQKMN